MAKLTLLLAAFALFFLLANASIYRTTVEIDDENPASQQSCQEQIQRQQQFRHCQMFLQQEVRGGEGGRWLSIDNQRQHFRQCCQQLEQVDSRCRCQGLEQAVRRQMQQGQFRGEEMQELYETASEIPRRCNVQPSQGCQFRSQYFSS